MVHAADFRIQKGLKANCTLPAKHQEDKVRELQGIQKRIIAAKEPGNSLRSQWRSNQSSNR